MAQEHKSNGWDDANIGAAFDTEYQRDLAAMSPREAKRTDRAVRRSTWRMQHPRLPGFLATVFVR